MRRHGLLAAAAVLALARGLGSEPAPPAAPAPFFAGETLEYAMSWGIFPGGRMTLSASEPLEFAGHRAVRLELSAISNDFISNFFVVRDSIVSWIDADTLASLRYEKHTVEGRRVRDERIDFDPERRVASTEDGPVSYDPPAFDSLSAVYYLRTLDLSSRRPVEFQLVAGHTAYTLGVDVGGEEIVKTPAGSFRTLKVHPRMKEGLLKKGGDLWLWLTEDDRKIPVLIRSKLNFGTLTARLIRMPGPADSR